MTPNEKLISEILRAAGRLTVARNALCAGFGISGARLRLLEAIYRLPVAFTVSALARSPRSS